MVDKDDVGPGVKQKKRKIGNDGESGLDGIQNKGFLLAANSRREKLS